MTISNPRFRRLRAMTARLRKYPTGTDVTVSSTAIKGIAYDPKLSRLDVTFQRGATYQYGCVTMDTYKAFLDAPSKGRFFVRNIRNTHPFLKATPAA